MDRPEHTLGREGFFHLLNIKGGVTDAHMDYIIRDFDRPKQEHRKDTLRHIADCLNDKYGAGTITLTIREQYRNMIEKLIPEHEHLLDNARKAIRMAGLEPNEVPFRGGTDGAMLSWKGLPCPNLGTGGFNFHGTGECITAERMDKATEILLNVVEIYSK
jgi:tripeptide aminopeptidase